MPKPTATARPWPRPWTCATENDGYVVRDANGNMVPVYRGEIVSTVILPIVNTFDKAREALLPLVKWLEEVCGDASLDEATYKHIKRDIERARAVLAEMDGEGES